MKDLVVRGSQEEEQRGRQKKKFPMFRPLSLKMAEGWEGEIK